MCGKAQSQLHRVGWNSQRSRDFAQAHVVHTTHQQHLAAGIRHRPYNYSKLISPGVGLVGCYGHNRQDVVIMDMSLPLFPLQDRGITDG